MPGYVYLSDLAEMKTASTQTDTQTRQAILDVASSLVDAGAQVGATYLISQQQLQAAKARIAAIQAGLPVTGLPTQQRRGIPWWGWVLGLGAVGGVVWLAIRERPVGNPGLWEGIAGIQQEEKVAKISERKKRKAAFKMTPEDRRRFEGQVRRMIEQGRLEEAEVAVGRYYDAGALAWEVRVLNELILEEKAARS